MNRYRKGVRLEAKSKKWLQDQGYCVPMRSAGSHGLFDLVAVAQGAHSPGPSVQLIQVKANKLPPPQEMALLGVFKRSMPHGVSAVIHVWRDRSLTPEVHVL